MIHRNLLLFRGARYLWWSLGLLIISGVIYATQGTVQPPNGGTWQGYVLGSIGGLLILWLTFLGVRKRSYNSTMPAACRAGPRRMSISARRCSSSRRCTPAFRSAGTCTRSPMC